MSRDTKDISTDPLNNGMDIPQIDEAFWKTIFKNISEGLFICELITDEHGKAIDLIYHYANPAAREQTGLDLENIEGKRRTEITSAEELVKSLEIYRSVVSTGKKESFQKHFQVCDRTLDFTAFPLGKKFFAVTVMDVSEQKEEHEKLTRSEEFLSATGKMAKVGGWELDPHSMEVSWTEETYNIHEVPHDHKPPLEEAINYFHPDDRPRLHEAIQLAIEKGVPYDLELRFRTAKGRELVTHTICKPILVDGKVVKLTGTFQDITERRAAEAASKERESIFQSIFEAANDGIAYLDRTGHVLAVNSRLVEEILGYSKEDSLGTTFLEQGRIAPEDLPKVMKKFGEVLRTRKPITDYEVNLIRADGRIVPTEIGTGLVKDEGEIKGVITIVRDITDRKKGQNELQRMTERMDLAVKAANIGIWENDVVNNRLYFDDKMLEIYGIRRDNFHGTIEDWLEILHPDDVETATEASREAVNSTESTEAEFRIIRPDGEIRHIKAYAQSMRGPEGQVLGASGVNIDVTELKLAELKLREREEQLRTIIEHSDEVFFIHDTKHQLSYVSPQSFDVMGYTPEEMMIKWTSLVTDNPINEKGFELTERAVQTGKRQPPYLLEVRRKDGELRIVEIDESPVKDDQGDIVAISGAVRDVTERVKTEEALRQEKDFTDTALNAQQDTFFLFDPATGEALRWNRTFREISGYTDEEIATLPVPASYYSSEDLERAIPFIEKVTREGTGTIELDLICKDDRNIPTEYRVSAIYDEEGKLKHFISIGRDITERRIAEKTLRERTNFLDRIIESSALSTWISDENGTAIRANPACLEFFGATEEEVIGNYNLFRDEVIENKGFMPDIRKVFEKGEVANIVIDYDFGAVDHVDVKDASHKIINSIFTPVLDSNNKVTNVIVQSIDLTEIKNTQAALMDSEERYKTFIEHSSEGIYRIDMVTPVPIDLPREELIKRINDDAVITEVNEALAEMYGLKADDMLGKYATEFAPNYGERASFVLLNDRHQVSGVETQDVDKDGKPLYLLESYHGEVLDKHLIRIWGVQRDITEQKRADEALRESEERYRTLIEHAPEAVVVLDVESKRFVDANENAMDFYNLSREELLKVGPLDMTPPVQPDGTPSREAAAEKIGQALKGEVPVFEWTHCNSNGQDIPCEVRLVRLPSQT